MDSFEKAIHKANTFLSYGGETERSINQRVGKIINPTIGKEVNRTFDDIMKRVGEIMYGKNK